MRAYCHIANTTPAPHKSQNTISLVGAFRINPSASLDQGSGRQRLRRLYFDLIVAASSARFFCQASYSSVPGRGGTSFGIPPNHVGTLSATTPLTAGRGSDAHAGNTIKAIVASAGLVIMIATTLPNHV
jgi:hypothetical protein